jgi:hypothetical protein
MSPADLSNSDANITGLQFVIQDLFVDLFLSLSPVCSVGQRQAQEMAVPDSELVIAGASARHG